MCERERSDACSSQPIHYHTLCIMPVSADWSKSSLSLSLSFLLRVSIHLSLLLHSSLFLYSLPSSSIPYLPLSLSHLGYFYLPPSLPSLLRSCVLLSVTSFFCHCLAFPHFISLSTPELISLSSHTSPLSLAFKQLHWSCQT